MHELSFSLSFLENKKFQLNEAKSIIVMKRCKYNTA